jgi:hypothetical protein
VFGEIADLLPIAADRGARQDELLSVASERVSEPPHQQCDIDPLCARICVCLVKHNEAKTLILK